MTARPLSRRMIELVEDWHPGSPADWWDRRTDYLCQTCAARRLPCACRKPFNAHDAMRWRPGDPTYQGTP